MKPLLLINSRLQYINTKIFFKYRLNYSYIYDPSYCEVTFRNFNSIKNYFLFIPLFTRTHRPIVFPIEYFPPLRLRRCHEVFVRIANKLANQEPSAEEQQEENRLSAMHLNCNADMYPWALTACLKKDRFCWCPHNRAPDFELEFR